MWFQSPTWLFHFSGRITWIQWKLYGLLLPNNRYSQFFLVLTFCVFGLVLELEWNQTNQRWSCESFLVKTEVRWLFGVDMGMSGSGGDTPNCWDIERDTSHLKSWFLNPRRSETGFNNICNQLMMKMKKEVQRRGPGQGITQNIPLNGLHLTELETHWGKTWLKNEKFINEIHIFQQKGSLWVCG